MKLKAIIGPLCILILCTLVSGCQPSPGIVGHKVQALLQQRLDAKFGKGNAKVSDVVVVRDNDKFEGAANITAFGAVTTLKMVILANRENVIYEVSPDDWNVFVITINKQKTSAIKGKYGNVAIANNTIFSCFPKVLKKDKIEFAKHLEVVVPVEHDGNVWFGSGCTQHECDSEEAAWAIDENTAKGYAIIFSTDRDGGKSFSIYGGDTNELPQPLLSWALDLGMNDFNSSVMRQ